MTTKYLRSAITAVNDIINRTIEHLSGNRLATKAMQIRWALESIASIYTTTMNVADMAADLGGHELADDVKALREMAEDVRIKGEQVHHWKNPENALDGMQEGIGIDGGRISAQMDLLLERIEEMASIQDERTIRRAVWSIFHRTGACPCPYPIGHTHRAIWVDEAAAIAAEFTDEILSEAPRAEIITIQDACRELNFQDALRVFGELPIYEVQNGEAFPLPTETPTTQQPEEQQPIPEAAVKVNPSTLKAAARAAKKWRKQNQYPGGVVIVHNGQAAGWMNEVRNPEGWEPGVIAIAETGESWIAQGGDTYNGASNWAQAQNA